MPLEYRNIPAQTGSHSETPQTRWKFGCADRHHDSRTFTTQDVSLAIDLERMTMREEKVLPLTHRMSAHHSVSKSCA